MAQWHFRKLIKVTLLWNPSDVSWQCFYSLTPLAQWFCSTNFTSVNCFFSFEPHIMGQEPPGEGRVNPLLTSTPQGHKPPMEGTKSTSESRPPCSEPRLSMPCKYPLFVCNHLGAVWNMSSLVNRGTSWNYPYLTLQTPQRSNNKYVGTQVKNMGGPMKLCYVNKSCQKSKAPSSWLIVSMIVLFQPFCSLLSRHNALTATAFAGRLALSQLSGKGRKQVGIWFSLDYTEMSYPQAAVGWAPVQCLPLVPNRHQPYRPTIVGSFYLPFTYR